MDLSSKMKKTKPLRVFQLGSFLGEILRSGDHRKDFVTYQMFLEEGQGHHSSHKNSNFNGKCILRIPLSQLILQIIRGKKILRLIRGQNKLKFGLNLV